MFFLCNEFVLLKKREHGLTATHTQFVARPHSSITYSQLVMFDLFFADVALVYHHMVFC